MSVLLARPQNEIFISPYVDRRCHGVGVKVQQDTTHARQVSARDLGKWLEDVVELGGMEPPTSTLPVLRYWRSRHT